MASPPRYSSVPFPPYRFVPGRHPHPTRHPDGHSYGKPEPAAPSDLDWRTCQPYLYGIDLFNHRYWWEAHEALEPLWHAMGRETPEGRRLQGLIQISAALLRHSMGTRSAQAKAEAGCAKLLDARDEFWGIEVTRLVRDVRRFLAGAVETPPVIHLTTRGDSKRQ